MDSTTQTTGPYSPQPPPEGLDQNQPPSPNSSFSEDELEAIKQFILETGPTQVSNNSNSSDSNSSHNSDHNSRRNSNSSNINDYLLHCDNILLENSRIVNETSQAFEKVWKSFGQVEETLERLKASFKESDKFFPE